jgi:hypothetical protein
VRGEHISRLIKEENIMAIPCLIIGKSGTGKSASLERCQDKDWNLIRVINKPLPFKGKIDGWHTDDYQTLIRCLKTSKAKSIVIDDAGYLITNHFMRGHSNSGTGNAIYSFYNTIADCFWNLIQTIMSLPDDKIVYVIMHEETDENGDTRPKTIGKLLDEKVCIEGMFTIALRCVIENGEHLFVTQTENRAVSKSPKGMFDDIKIPNDLRYVDEHIRDYYDIAKINYSDESEEMNND